MKKFLVLAALALVTAFGVLVAELYRPYADFSGTLVVEIPPGTSAMDVAKILVERGVLKHRAPFLFRYAVGRPRSSLKAGEYSFDRPLRPVDVYRKLVEGEVRLFTVVIPEGSDRFDMARIFHERLGIDPDEFLRATRATEVIHDLDPQAPTLEGYLFPDTYRFARNATAARVVEVMLARERQVLKDKFRVELSEPGQNLHDVVTLASLVEKETPDASERPLIAGVFARRLKIGLPLACDPTVIYSARLDHRMLDYPLPPIYESDLQFKSPYNTYLHAGLPPGPIASPGETSLRAAFHPAQGDALYFVSNTHGGHIFSKTLAEHLRNVARYRRQVAEIRRQESQPTDISKQKAPKSRGGNGTKKKSAQRARH
ncbi:MAG: endolytic transglycosylase MltG [Deltaproteobacteria bacterium]